MPPATPPMTAQRPFRRARWLGVLVLFASLALMAFDLPGLARPAAAPPPVFFPETGHTLQEPFLKYFLDTGAVGQYGYPRTEEYVDPATHLLVQYFDNARFEWHPDNPAPYQVQLGLLDVELGRQQAPLPPDRIPPADDPNCQYFAETGHSLCYAFRDYWEQNGGLDRFGYPIGEYALADGLIIQDFQRARLEWHPAGAGPRVQLPPLGLRYYQAAGFDPYRLKPVEASAHARAAVSVRARASVFKPFVVAGDSQVAFVFVTDSSGRPLDGVAVTLRVNAPDGAHCFNLPPTTAGGTSFQIFGVGQYPVGAIVPLDFILTYPGQADTATRTSFMVGY